MHVPDGFIDAPVSVAAGAVAAGAVAVALRGARRELQERTAPLAGLVAAFVFAVQMLNFPVGAGTSGHLLGGALAAILVGPYTGVLCISVVLLMQAVLFADGGLTALGVNIATMGVVGVLTAYGVFRGLVTVLPRRRTSVTGAAFAAAVVSVPTAAAAFVGFYALGGTVDVTLGKVLGAMVGVHVLIGIGEAAITALTVGAVLSVRPDLVYGARGLTAPLTLRTGAAPAVPGTPAAAEQSLAARTGTQTVPIAVGTVATAAHRRTGRLWLAGLATTLTCAGVLSFYASANPDGLEKVAAEFGFEDTAREHGMADSPLADYGVADVENARLSSGIAGMVGVGATLAVGSGVFVTVRRRRSASAGAADGGALTRAGTGASPRPVAPPGTQSRSAQAEGDRHADAASATKTSACRAGATTRDVRESAVAHQSDAPGTSGLATNADAAAEAEPARTGDVAHEDSRAASCAGNTAAEGSACTGEPAAPGCRRGGRGGLPRRHHTRSAHSAGDPAGSSEASANGAEGA